MSYVLPIIVVILSAKPDSLIMIENPEAHLHPKAQSKLAEPKQDLPGQRHNHT
ncbi:MAG: AAA family ATPase [Pseudomonadota bacterium]